MQEVATKEIDNYRITYYPLTVRQAARLDLKVMRALSPVIKSLGSIIDGLDAKAQDAIANVMNTDVSALLNAIHDTLQGLDDSVADELMFESLRGCTVCAPGNAPVQVQSAEDVDRAFRDLDVLYRAMYEGWRYNKLTPFAVLSRIGRKIPVTGTSDAPESTTRASGLRLER